MQGYAACRRANTPLLLALVASLFACTPAPDPGMQEVPGVVLIDARPAAIVDGRMVEWDRMRPLLGEAAGAVVLREVILDRKVAEALGRAGVALTPDDVDAERQLFHTTLHADADMSVRLSREVRDAQGLGPKRFARLLRRNAGLRALVADQVQVTEEAIVRKHELLHGPRRQARLMVLPSLVEARSALRRLDGGEPFGDVAVDVSTDSSAARGGLLEPISRADASYPEALREALWSLQPGERSPPILLESGYAVLRLEREVEGDGVPLNEVRPELQRLVRLDQQRLLMDRLARRLLSEATVTIYDEGLQFSWEAQKRMRR